jgi:DNA (cytosine-5)-methyltransferase 1
VLAHRYPSVPNLGDANAIHKKAEFNSQKLDVLVGGTPCTSFSQAGRRQGIADPRGKLALRFLELAGMRRPRWILWENVPEVLRSNGGRDFGQMLSKLGKVGYGCSWHVLDTRDFGLGQSRQRVFLVGHSDWRRAAAVFSEPEMLRANLGTDGVPKNPDPRGDGKCAAGSESVQGGRSEGQRQEASPRVIAIRGNTLDRNPEAERLGAGFRKDDIMYCLTSTARHAVLVNGIARHLLPVEAERLQGFPDNYTKIPYKGMPAERCPDELRHQAVGNAAPVPIMRWIGERIGFVESLPEERVASFLPPEDFAKTLSDSELIQKCVQSFRQLRDLIPYLREARERFAQPGRRVPVPGNPTWTEWVERNLGISVRRVQQLLREALEPSEIISLGRPKGSGRLVTGDWRGLLEATERRLEQVFGALQDEEELSEAVRKYAQGIADRFGERHGRLTVSVSVKSRA